MNETERRFGSVLELGRLSGDPSFIDGLLLARIGDEFGDGDEVDFAAESTTRLALQELCGDVSVVDDEMPQLRSGNHLKDIMRREIVVRRGDGCEIDRAESTGRRDRVNLPATLCR